MRPKPVAVEVTAAARVPAPVVALPARAPTSPKLRLLVALVVMATAAVAAAAWLSRGGSPDTSAPAQRAP